MLRPALSHDPAASARFPRMESSAAAPEPLIRIVDVSRRYVRGVDDIHALERVSLEIPAGCFVAFMGPSGSGKSTLMNLVSGIDQPSEGEVLVAGQSLGELSEDELADWRARHVGLIFQFFNLIPCGASGCAPSSPAARSCSRWSWSACSSPCPRAWTRC